jgi:uncharacterized protein with von Willebrand factor type A (vWA) domain
MSRYTPDPRHLGRSDDPVPRTGSGAPGSDGRADGAHGAGQDTTGDGATLTRAARFSRWDGTQAIPSLDADEILDAMADDIMAEGDVGEALRRLMERGWRSDDPSRPELTGLHDLLRRLREQRESMLDRYSLGDVVSSLRRELDGIVDQERGTAEKRLADASGLDDEGVRRAASEVASRRLRQLDELPPSTGDRIRALQDDEFLDQAAKERFDALVERLQRVALDRVAEGLADAIQGLTPETLAANREMVQALNELLEQRLAGGDPDASDFLSRFGDAFPGARDLDDIIDQLAERMAAASSLLRSLRPEQRAELQSMMDAALRDDRLRWDLARLAANLDRLTPGGTGERLPFSGGEPIGLEEALERIEDIQALEAMETGLETAGTPQDLDDIDAGELARLAGPESARDLEALRRLSAVLEQAGYLTRRGRRLTLTPQGSRRIGQAVLDELFAKLQRDAFGGHAIERSGRGGEPEETTKPYEFGDPFLLDLRATLGNALRREENAPARRGAAGLSLRPEDFEVRRTELQTRASTVLLVDLSRSMLLRGCFTAAKKVALALDTLIRTRFPRDDLAIIGFAYYAREIRPEALPELNLDGFEYGTNLQHALQLARQRLVARPGGTREIVVITDGEPTAHFEDGQVEFNYPPTRRTIHETLREVARCTRAGITINTFMLERSPGLTEFVARMTRLNHGRAFYADPEHLGRYVLVDFVSRRTKRVG